MGDMLPLDLMTALFAFGTLSLALSSTHFEDIQDRSSLLCSRLMEGILPLWLMTALFAFGTLALALSSIHSEAI
jgi:hypothetical protein